MALHSIDHHEKDATPANRTDANSGVKGIWTIQEAATYLSLPVNSLYKMTGPKARLRVPHIRIAVVVDMARKAGDVLAVSDREDFGELSLKIDRRIAKRGFFWLRSYRGPRCRVILRWLRPG
jgi:hypothetical protein